MSTTEKWREDFPIEWEKDQYTTRREFTKFLVLTSGALFTGNGYFVIKRLWKGGAAFPSAEIARTDELPIGGVKLFRYPTEADPAMLVRLDGERFVAYQQRCTHLSCPVYYTHARTRLECPCHNGAFNIETGEVLFGPPPRPLPSITLRIAGGRIFAEGMDKGEA
jgi:Rieske Fe-S protein